MKIGTFFMICVLVINIFILGFILVKQSRRSTQTESTQPARSIDFTNGEIIRDVCGSGGCVDVKIITIGGQKYVLAIGSNKVAICPVTVTHELGK